MANKIIQEEEKMRNETDEIKEGDLIGEVEFKIDKDAFKGPFKCCGTETEKIKKKISIKGIGLSYDSWICHKCKREYLDSEQAKRLEKIWVVEKILNEKLISVEKNVNFDGKTFFVRFPVEMTKNWHRGLHADIKYLGPDEFFVKIKS